MTRKEEKDLLLKYLCMALPYEVKVLYDNNVFDIDYISPLYEEVKLDIANNYTISISEVKPYLRTLASMTEDELSELSNIISECWDKELFTLTEEPMIEFALSRLKYSINPMLFNWLLEHHFDFLDLIPKNLAIEVTKENNPYN